MSTQLEENETTNELKENEEESHNVQNEKAKDTENKKLDKKIKKEVVKKSYKYESKRDKETDDSRRTKRSEKGITSSRREDEKSDDTGKKRYSESRKGCDSQRDKYKDRDKNKTYDKKKSISNDTASINGKSTEKSNVEVNVSTEEVETIQCGKCKEESLENDKITKSKVIGKKLVSKSSSMNKVAKSVTLEIKEKRRKSLDNTMNITNYENEFSKSMVELGETKRRNSVGSRESNTNTPGFKSFLKSLSLDNKIEDKELLEKDNSSTSSTEHKEVSIEQNFSCPHFEDKDKDVVKRRNSTGDSYSPGKSSTRRNSLGSEDKNTACTFIDNSVSTNVTCEENKSKEQSTEKKDGNRSDPRTERRIRNKVRITFLASTNNKVLAKVFTRFISFKQLLNNNNLLPCFTEFTN